MDKKTKIILAVVAAVLVILLIIWAVMLRGKNTTSNNTNTISSNSEISSVSRSYSSITMSNSSVGNVTFTLPDGWTSDKPLDFKQANNFILTNGNDNLLISVQQRTDSEVNGDATFVYDPARLQLIYGTTDITGLTDQAKVNGQDVLIPKRQGSVDTDGRQYILKPTGDNKYTRMIKLTNGMYFTAYKYATNNSLFAYDTSSDIQNDMITILNSLTF